jgi:hypothetical protein
LLLIQKWSSTHAKQSTSKLIPYPGTSRRYAKSAILRLLLARIARQNAPRHVARES